MTGAPWRLVAEHLTHSWVKRSEQACSFRFKALPNYMELAAERDRAQGLSEEDCALKAAERVRTAARRGRAV